MKVLITGFDAFGGEPVNPAEEAVKKVSDRIQGAEIIKVIIPTVQTKSVQAIERAIEEHNPDMVISIGQAGGRFDITPERVAINIDDYRIKDNEGNQPIDAVIKEDGQAAYFSNLPVKAMVKHMNDNGVPATLSNTAGTFVCNHVMYGILYMIDKKYPNIKGGFIHIPYMTSQVMDKKNTPFMSLDEIVKGLELAIEACILNDKDIEAIGGEIC
ncbi:pyrrolidone-carboxylate peptidase [Bacillus sp. FJAT-27916]|uniref:pyroglutamyl-peptidase I n=1 Tax=Bacillus sp. FJAT-27916 TaxID=1679169 RepID=UPI00067148F8|nr:pyroglutamyl-peptidase I [Bacillus sp. FJAT-27916]KMY44017.1 pyrrolidone-carboxylate peptidase [Bacillus sp. FJAT-27916]